MGYFQHVYAARNYTGIDMKKKKIAQVVTRLDFEGVPDLYRMIASSLLEEYDVTLILGPSAHMTLKTKEFLDKFPGKIVRVPMLCRNISPLKDILAFFHLFFIFLFSRYDIVHTHTAKAGLLGRFAAKAAWVKKIIHMPHGHNFYGYFNRNITSMIIFAERLAAFCTDKLIVLTELSKKDYLARKIIKAEKIEVVPSGMELSAYESYMNVDVQSVRSSWGFKESDKCVVLASRLAHVKGSDIALEIAECLVKRRKDIVFVFVGQGPMEAQLKKIVEEKELIDNVRFLGWRDDVLDIVASSQILLQPSRNEAVGRSLLEAQLLGVPVVASRVGGIPEVVSDGKTGLLYDHSRITDAIDAIERLVDDENYARKLSENASAWVKDNFSSELMINKIKDLYK